MSQKALLLCIVLLFCLFSKLSFGQYSYNKAASFNGVNSYYSIPSTGKFNFTSVIKIQAWIKPTATRTMAIVGKNFQTGYYFGLNSANQLRFYKGNSFVETTVSVPINEWTQVGVAYDGTLTLFYINGNLLGLSSALTGAIPVNSDSVRIGADGTTPAYFFQGEIDDVTFWTDINATYNYYDRTLSPAVPYTSGIYSGLIASYRMNGDGNGTAIYDEVFPIADGEAHNVSFIDYSKNPTYHSSYNSSVYFDFNQGYISSPNNAVYNATTAITLEAWVRKDTTGVNNDYMDIINKSGSTDRNNYNLAILGSTLAFAINNNERFIQFGSPSLLNGRWHHVAATYNSSTGSATLYLDGNQVAQSVFSGAPLISNDPDSLFIGKMGASGFSNTNFKGQMDEVRIWKNTERTPAQIKANMFKNIDFASPSAPSSSECCIFGFEGRTYNSLVNIDLALPSAVLYLRGPVYFVSDTKAFLLPVAKSPMLRDDANDFAGSSYQISTKPDFIPDNNPAGLTDSVFIGAPGLISSIRLFTLIDHPSVYDLSYSGAGTGITLTSPTGVSVQLIPNAENAYQKDLMTIFDMNADSTIRFNLGSNYCVAPFSPTVKPANSFSVFTGLQQQGWWKLKIVDRSPGSIGYLNGWGMQTQLLTGVSNEPGVPGKYELSQNYPNPFNPSTKINYQLKYKGFVTLKIFDVLGKEIAKLVNENQNAGSYAVEFNTEKYMLSSGIYFYRIDAGEFTETKRMMLLK